MLNIGCHLSSSKGFLAMGKTALSIGANTFQFFTRNPRGGKAKAVNPEDAAALVKLCQENNFAKLLAHAPYTMNPCAADEGLRDFARNVMEGDLAMLEYVPGNLYNFHPGSHVKQGVEVGIEKISAMLNDVLHKDLHTTVLLETMAGKGSEVGRTFEELRAILDKVRLNEKMGVCLDTCHIFDALVQQNYRCIKNCCPKAKQNAEQVLTAKARSQLANCLRSIHSRIACRPSIAAFKQYDQHQSHGRHDKAQYLLAT